MDVEAALSKAILDDPEDDLPRLAYADWLEERGGGGGGGADGPRAELIRAQCAAARLPQGDPERNALERRAAELWGRHCEEWFGPRVARLGPGWCERGFLSGLTTALVAALVGDSGRADRAWPLGPVPLVCGGEADRRLHVCPWLAS